MPLPLSCAGCAALTVSAVLLQILGVSLFTYGFFPVKPALPGRSGPESYQRPSCEASKSSAGQDVSGLSPAQLGSIYKELSEITPAFDRLVLMVIDGLPAEFVLGGADTPPLNEHMDAMPYTQSLLSSGKAIGYHAKAAPPTVTMPRLKAIVSGAIGSFLDVAFNFNTQAFLDDNLIEQFHRIGWKMVMLGDETWIKMFPRLFSRQDGVSSFYVKDTVEVDYNVTRHLDSELSADDWDLLILHYLGTDHVGHIGGRRSMLMKPKLNEMDGVIKKIFNSVILLDGNDSKRTLLLVVSDHGMTDSGNHGGSSHEETDALALFIVPGGQLPHQKPVRKAAYQVDVAPILAILFGVPIPKNNVGVLLPEMLDFLKEEEKLRALELNSWQLVRLLQGQLPGFCADTLCSRLHNPSSENVKLAKSEQVLCYSYTAAVRAHEFWRNHSDSNPKNFMDQFLSVREAYREFLGAASEWLSSQATDKPRSILLVGTGMMLISSILMLKIFLCLRKEAPHIQKKSLALSNSCLTIDEAFILFSAVLHAISLSSSSMVEEEQYIWHYLVSTLYMIFLGMKISTILAANKSNQCDGVMGKANDLKLWSCEKKLFSFNLVEKPLSRFKEHHNYFQIPYLLVVLILGRIIRGWHQGGVNWTHLPDIAKWLDRSGSSTMNCFCIISLLVVIVISPTAIYLMRSQKILACTFLVCHFLSGMLILLQKVLHQRIMSLACSTDSLPKIIYSTVLISLIVILLSPWFINIKSEKDPCSIKVKLQPSPDLWIELALSESIKDCLHLFSGAFTATWCLLQMLLQRPVNMTPVLLLLLQIFSTKLYFMVEKGSRHKLWVEVASMYFLGMAGHFGLGNSNSIATIDVAGAFTGLSNHSTIFAGTLMFMITYASPLLISFSMIMFLPLDHLKFSPNRTATELINGLKITLGSSCLVPLSLNSVTLIFFTLVLYSMRNHLFVWSVFSPKYLYVCAASMSVYIGISIIAASVAYIILVLIFRIKMTS